jgi:hypothetical protein
VNVTGVREAEVHLVSRLRNRRGEIEQATLTRVGSVVDPGDGPDPEYADGLRVAVAAAVEYGIAAIEGSEDRPPPIPTALLAQARLAARHGIQLETVLRRYVAGYTLLGDIVISESEQAGLLDGGSLKRSLRVLAALLDRLIVAVSEEYARELRTRCGSVEQLRTERVKRLLDGEFVDQEELAYDFSASHLGILARGPGVAERLRESAQILDRRLLLVRPQERTVWAWIATRPEDDPDRLTSRLEETWPDEIALAFGQPWPGIEGWRLTHRQARAALPVALRSPRPFVRYAEVALLATIIQDDLLATSLRRLYLDPLQRDRDGGKMARETLRAYFANQRNVSSAAAVLGVNRRTVHNRLQAIEERLDHNLDSVAAEFQAILRFDELAGPHHSFQPESH